MATINPQFITDVNGVKLSVVLPIDEFEAIMEELDELEDVKLYDEAKRDDDGERILLSDYLKSRQKLHV